jgi:hypothetical protein
MVMSLRSALVSRRFILQAFAVATFGIAGVGYSVMQRAFADPPPEKAKRSDHLPVTALRDRLLASYHGHATDMFTAIPGFGMERMPPLYKQIPFELPEFSTNEVETTQAIAPPNLLKDVFDQSLNSFHDPSKPIPAKNAAPNNPFFSPPGFGRAFGGPNAGPIRSGLQLRLLDLVGLTDPDGARVYSGGKAFEIVRMSNEEAKKEREKNPGAAIGIIQIGRAAAAKDAAKADLQTRPLDLFETAGVVELSQGKELFIRQKGNVVRMLGALRAREQCLKCHSDTKKGDLLGAFSYTFVDTNGTLAREAKEGSKKK